MAEFHYEPTPSSMTDNMRDVTKPQPPQVYPKGAQAPIDGQSLLNAKAPGKLNENRFSSLKPSRQTK